MKPRDIVQLLTDTAVDEEGVPVSVGKGNHGIVMEVDEEFVQVLCNTAVGRDVVGFLHKELKVDNDLHARRKCWELQVEPLF
jgi:hypothetical protein